MEKSIKIVISDEVHRVFNIETGPQSLFRTELIVDAKPTGIDFNHATVSDLHLDPTSPLYVVWQKREVLIPPEWSKTLVLIWNSSKFANRLFDCRGFVSAVLTGSKDLHWYLADHPCEDGKIEAWPHFCPVEMLQKEDETAEHVLLHLFDGLFLSKCGSFSEFPFQNYEQIRSNFPETLLWFLIRKSVCDGCREAFYAEMLKTCGRCKLAHYCSKQCQIQHWKTHRKHCNTPKEATENGRIEMLKFALTQDATLARFAKEHPLHKIPLDYE